MTMNSTCPRCYDCDLLHTTPGIGVLMNFTGFWVALLVVVIFPWTKDWVDWLSDLLPRPSSARRRRTAPVAAAATVSASASQEVELDDRVVRAEEGRVRPKTPSVEITRVDEEETGSTGTSRRSIANRNTDAGEVSDVPGRSSGERGPSTEDGSRTSRAVAEPQAADY